MQWAASAEKQPSATRVEPRADGAEEPRAADQSTWDFTFCKMPASLNTVRTLSASPPQETAAKKGPQSHRYQGTVSRSKTGPGGHRTYHTKSLQITAFLPTPK